MRTPSTTASDFDSCRAGSASARMAATPSADRSNLSQSFLIQGSVAALLTFAFILAIAAPAMAITTGHTYAFTFPGGGYGTGNGQFLEGNYNEMGVAVDQSTGNVYVSDPNNARIQQFDAAGNFLQAWGYGVSDGSNTSQVCSAPSSCQQGIPGAAPGQFNHPTGIAVDNSGGPNDGAVYLIDPTNKYVQKFTSNGVYLGKIDGSTTPGGPFDLLPPAGISVDGKGIVWVADDDRIMKFAGDEENEYIGGSEFLFRPLIDPFDHQSLPVLAMAVSPAGSRVYVVSYFEGNCCGLYRMPSNGSPVELVAKAGGWPAVDPVSDHLLLASGGQIREYNGTNELVAPPFGQDVLTIFSAGLAVNEATEIVYVADYIQGKVFAFKPRVIPDVATGPPLSVGHKDAMVSGDVAPDPADGGDVSECHFEFVREADFAPYIKFVAPDQIYAAFGSNAPCEPATPYSGLTAVSAALSSLALETKYRYRLVASNSIDAAKGIERTFMPRAVLGLSTDPATAITQTAATLNGSFDPAGDGTHYHFEWGPTTSYGNTTAPPPGIDAGSAPGSTSVSAEISGLTSNTKYHYRIVATNSLGTSYGEDQIARTAPPLLPQVSETAVGAVADQSAAVEASINPGFGETVYRVEYGPSTSYGQQTLPGDSIGADDANHPVTTGLLALTPGTTYHFRFVATNFAGTTHGPDRTFTTPAAPTIGVAGASAITPTTASVSASVNPTLRPTTYSFEYGPGPGYGQSTPTTPIGADNEAHPATASLSGLQSATTYHFRITATNAIGTTSSPDQSFTTLANPAQKIITPPAKCRKGQVRKRGKCVKRRPKHRSHRKSRRHG